MSIAATAGVRVGMHTDAVGTRIQERRHAATSPGYRPAACMLVAQVRRAILPDGRSPRGRGAITRFAPPDAGGPFRRPPPVVRRRDSRRAEGDAGRAEGTAMQCTVPFRRGLLVTQRPHRIHSQCAPGGYQRGDCHRNGEDGNGSQIGERIEIADAVEQESQYVR